MSQRRVWTATVNRWTRNMQLSTVTLVILVGYIVFTLSEYNCIYVILKFSVLRINYKNIILSTFKNATFYLHFFRVKSKYCWNDIFEVILPLDKEHDCSVLSYGSLEVMRSFGRKKKKKKKKIGGKIIIFSHKIFWNEFSYHMTTSI